MSKSGQSPTGSDVRIPERLFFRIRDVAKLVGVEPYVLRYWETEFPQVAPNKSAAGHRVYRRADVETILLIKKLLYTERYSIEGARKRLAELKKLKGGDVATAAPVAAASAVPALRPAPESIAEIKAAAESLASLVRETQVSDLFAWG